MTLVDFAAKNWRRAQSQGALAALKSMKRETTGKIAARPYIHTRQALLRRQLPDQARLLDEFRSSDEWLLIVLDAGRYDYLKPLLEDQFEARTTKTFSAARDTFEWISTQWVGNFDDVTYLSGMTPIDNEYPDYDIEGFNELYHTDEFVDDIGEIVPLWRDEWDVGLSSVPAERVTERALEYVDSDKLVVHYTQPHSPFIGTPKLLGHTNNESARPHQGRPNDEPIWDRVQSGAVSDHYLRMAYQGNAARAVAALHPLISAWDGENIVVTADHGEALGEWGMYTHDRAPHPKRRVVPWAQVDGIADTVEGEKGRVDRNDQLRALGYR